MTALRERPRHGSTLLRWDGNTAYVVNDVVARVLVVGDRHHWVLEVPENGRAGSCRGRSHAMLSAARAYARHLKAEGNNRLSKGSRTSFFEATGGSADHVQAVDYIVHDVAQNHGMEVRRVLELRAWRLSCPGGKMFDVRWAVVSKLGTPEVVGVILRCVSELVASRVPA